MKGNIVVGQSGGPTAVINSSVAGVYAAAKKLGVKKIYGMVHGIEGFLEDRMIDLGEYLNDETGIELLKRTPSAFLGSCRFKMPKIEGHEDVYEKVFRLWKNMILNAFSMQVETIPWIRLRCFPTMQQLIISLSVLWVYLRRLITICR